jgi:hypothetical protein
MRAVYPLAARAKPDASQCPLTGFVSMAKAWASFPVDASLPWAYQCDPAIAMRGVWKELT